MPKPRGELPQFIDLSGNPSKLGGAHTSQPNDVHSSVSNPKSASFFAWLPTLD